MRLRASLSGRASLMLAVAAMLTVPFLMTGCTDDAPQGTTAAVPTEGCVACHSSADALTGAGLPEGAEAVAYLVSQEFLDSSHASAGCVKCHGGDANADDKTTAMADIVTDPSADLATCGGSDCHDDITSTFEGSLHSTASGILEKLKVRLSNTPDGEALAEAVFSADDSCYGCHATCGQCHVSIPAAFGGGLLDGHNFTDATAQEYNDVTCAQCHDAIGPMYVERDLHHEMGYSCADCHTDPKEVHGDGGQPTSMAEGNVSVECVDCHSDLSPQTHSRKHLEGATCDACHSVPYWNCIGCHAEDGSPESIEETVKLAKGTDGRITPVSRMGISEEMFGEPKLDMDLLNTKAAWILSVPHTVQPAERTEELCDRCHGSGTALLKASDLQFPDFEEQLLLEPLRAVKP